MRLFNWLDYKVRASSYRIWIALVFTIAFCSVVVDVDHPISFYLGIPNGRFLHPYFELAGYILVSCGTIFLIACLGRYLRVRVLKKLKGD